METQDQNEDKKQKSKKGLFVGSVFKCLRQVIGKKKLNLLDYEKKMVEKRDLLSHEMPKNNPDLLRYWLNNNGKYPNYQLSKQWIDLLNSRHHEQLVRC